MHYVFFINNIELGEIASSAKEIMNFLLENNLWAFSFNAPNLKYLNYGDRAVVYLAGRGNRCFAANFTIASKPYEVKSEPNQPNWLTLFPIRIDIKDISSWTEALPIGDVLALLDFIKNKKNYGFYFRQSTKLIEEKDFFLILGASECS